MATKGTWSILINFKFILIKLELLSRFSRHDYFAHDICERLNLIKIVGGL